MKLTLLIIELEKIILKINFKNIKIKIKFIKNYTFIFFYLSYLKKFNYF